MADSYMEQYLPLKTSPQLLDEYIFFDGRIRLGKILEGTFEFICFLVSKMYLPTDSRD
jgi:hypothetical protein